MDDKLKTALTELFDKFSFELTEMGFITTTYFLIKGKTITRVRNIGLEEDMYAAFVMRYADKEGAEGIVVLGEKKVVSGKPEDADMQALIDGKLSIGQHSDTRPYLVLMYMGRDGENQALFGKIEKDPSGVKFTKNHEWATDIAVH
jgi:hypothetical protein